MATGIKTAQLDYQYHAIDMHDIDYRFFIQQNTADALVLAILADFKDSETKTVVHEVLTKLIAITQNDNKALREYVSMLEILATNRDINLDIQQEFEMLEIELEKLPSYLIGEKKGEKKGKHKKAIAIAKQLVNFNLSLEEISQITGITLSELVRMNIGKK